MVDASRKDKVDRLTSNRIDPYQTPDPDSGYIRMYLSPPEGPRTGFAALADGRLRVPQYLYAMETFFNLVLLAVFTWVVNERTPNPGFMEWLMYVTKQSLSGAQLLIPPSHRYILVIAAAFDEIRQVSLKEFSLGETCFLTIIVQMINEGLQFYFLTLVMLKSNLK